MLPANSLNVKTSLVQSDLPARPGGSPRRAAQRAQSRSADPGLAGPHLREAALSEGTRMLSVINPDLLWLALGFILSMAGMLATYPE
jgi:hypothetical protein